MRLEISDDLQAGEVKLQYFLGINHGILSISFNGCPENRVKRDGVVSATIWRV